MGTKFLRMHDRHISELVSGRYGKDKESIQNICL